MIFSDEEAHRGSLGLVAGFEIPSASLRLFDDVECAVASFGERRPDVLWAKGYNLGVQLSRRLAAQTRHRTPTVLASGVSDGPDNPIVAEALTPNGGADSFMQLPFDSREFILAMQSAARMRRAFVHAGAQ
jgi:FixJ family two-component response regulator